MIGKEEFILPELALDQNENEMVESLKSRRQNEPHSPKGNNTCKNKKSQCP